MPSHIQPFPIKEASGWFVQFKNSGLFTIASLSLSKPGCMELISYIIKTSPSTTRANDLVFIFYNTPLVAAATPAATMTWCRSEPTPIAYRSTKGWWEEWREEGREERWEEGREERREKWWKIRREIRWKEWAVNSVVNRRTQWGNGSICKRIFYFIKISSDSS